MRPILRVGLRALMAYWGTTETSRSRWPVHGLVISDRQVLAVELDGAPTCFIRPSRKTRLLPSVDFPQPDSPAKPMISPSAIEKLTPSTA